MRGREVAVFYFSNHGYLLYFRIKFSLTSFCFNCPSRTTLSKKSALKKTGIRTYVTYLLMETPKLWELRDRFKDSLFMKLTPMTLYKLGRDLDRLPAS